MLGESDKNDDFEDSDQESTFSFKRGCFEIGVLKKQHSQKILGRPASDFSQIIHGNPVYIRKKLSYTGHASTVYSVEQALAIVEFIGKNTKSERSLPYAISLVENGQYVSIIEDNGEFGCGKSIIILQ